ncbi:hypothetical protein PHYPO_G00030230 [Pangasianodon hypophthalmus]|uniref:Uncharacterized protein n=1 Tax=Pangasianodon hypophthalmus TaxID=310915 RepID=A0A5N5ML96_PANHP|nr:hypothetical protein PHYPO_G00030230 [Pangasianodon hypophthalmus]
MYRRKNHIPCMYNLISLSFTLGQNYGIKMYIGFTKFYVFCTNMSNIFNNSKELDVNSKKIIEASDLNQLKFSVQFNISEFKHEFKKFMMNIPKNKRKVVYGNRMFPQSLDLALIYEEWKQEGIQTAEQLASEMSVKIGESASEMMPIFDKLKPVIINWWDKNVNRSMLLNERFSDFIEKNVVLHYLDDIQHREHHPELFQIDCYCLANEE